jgi:hypothetical protein
MQLRLAVFRALLALMLVGVAFGADINGKWKGTVDAGGMTIEQTFAFKVDGETITGTMSDQFIGEAKITAGALKGNDISFTVSGNSDQMGPMTLNFKGKVTGADEMKLTMAFSGGPGGGGPGGEAMEIIAKRVK